MKKDFFDNLTVAQVIQIIRDLAEQSLFPSQEAFSRLRELEEETGRDVEALLADILDGSVLRAYQDFKDPPSAWKKLFKKSSHQSRPPEATGGQQELLLTIRTDRFSGNTLLFERIRQLHLRWVPVFTMMHKAGEVDLMDDYRTWLTAQYA